MRKKNFLWMLTALILMTACSKDEQEIGQTPKMQKLSIEVTMGSDGQGNETRASYATWSNTIRESFVEGDEIGVYGMNGTEIVASNVKFTYTDGTWVPETDVPYSEAYYYYAYFPYQSTATLTSRSCSFSNASAPDEEEDDTDTKMATFLSNWPIATDQSDVDDFEASDLLAARGVNQVLPVVRFTMKHKMSMMQIVPSNNKYYYSYDTTTGHSMDIAFSGNIPYHLGDNYYYIMRPDVSTTVGGITASAPSGRYYYKRIATATGEYNLEYSTDGGSSFSSTKPSWLTITENGKSDLAFTITPNATSTAACANTLSSASPVSDYDLSLHDVSGNSVSRTTANCYIIHSTGTYKLPLVYGNAFKNGNDNTPAYKPSAHDSGDKYLTPFVNSSNVGINSPWIKDNSETPASCGLIWQDAYNNGVVMISAVSISGDYLTFTVPTGAPCGNAIVATYDSGGNILWTWHIWGINTDIYNTDALTNITSGNYTYNVAPVNLGWTGEMRRDVYSERSCVVKLIPTTTGATQTFEVEQPACVAYVPTSTGYCPYYQWGRKDAEPPSTGASGATHTLYDTSGSTVTGITHSSSAVNIATTIRNPTIHYYNSSNYGPYSTNQYNLWDANENNITNDGNYGGNTVKTIYDPCPPGFCVPRGNLYFTIPGIASAWVPDIASRYWNTFPTLYFPASGLRYTSSGSTIYLVGSSGYCWSSSAHSGTYARILYLYSSGCGVYYDARAYGFTVRPVQEN